MTSKVASADRALGVADVDYDVLEAKYVGGYTVWVRFRDGSAGEVDLSPVLWGPVFEPLKDPAYFRTFIVHPEFLTLVWPNGADVAPEYLHSAVGAHGMT
jgi:hypothetical protein